MQEPVSNLYLTKPAWNITYDMLFLVQPATGGTITVLAGGKTFNSLSYSLDSRPVSSVLMYLLTPRIYHDSNVFEVLYQVKDATGMANVLTDSLSVNINVWRDHTTLRLISSCALPDYTGLALCRSSLPITWFTNQSDSFVTCTTEAFYGSNRVAISRIANITLNIIPTIAVTPNAGMTVTFPHHPLYPGDIFTLSISASTNGNALTAWVISLYFKSNLMSFVSLSTGHLYTDAVYVQSTGKIKMSTSGVGSGVSSQDVTGANIGVISLTFQLLSTAKAGVIDDAAYLYIDSMVNVFSLTFAGNINAKVFDMRGGSYESGQLAVANVSCVGIATYVTQNMFLNSAPLTGVDISSVIYVVAIYNKLDIVYKDVSSSSICNTTSSSVLSVASCVVKLQSSHYRGSSNASVIVSYGGYTSTVTYFVWYPTAISVIADDVSLDYISMNGTISGSCGKLQQTALRALATLSCPGLTTYHLYITDIVTFTTSDSSIASLNRNILKGLKYGTVTTSILSYNIKHPIQITSAIVQVGKSIVRINSIDVSAVTALTGVQNFVKINPSNRITPNFFALQSLTAEGQSANIIVYLNFDDGHHLDVSQLVTVSSLVSSIGITYGSYGAVATVLPNAASVCGQILVATWSHCRHNISGIGAVAVNMPQAISVTLSASTSVISFSTDTASKSPFNIPTSVTLAITVYYADSSSKSFSSPYDSRALLSITSGNTLASLTTNTMTVSSAGVAGIVQIRVTFPGLYTVNAAVNITVVKYSSLSISTSAYPAQNPVISKNIIQLLGCTGVYQRLIARAIGRLSNGVITDVTAFSTYASNVSSVVYFESGSLLTGLSAGTGAVSASFGGLVSSRVSVTVTSTRVSVTSLVASFPSAQSNTFVAVKNSTSPLAVNVFFSDGTNYGNAIDGPSKAWISPSQLMFFNTSMSSIMSISSSGQLKLLNNYYTSITINVFAFCSTATSRMAIYANLRSKTYDVDMGSVTGATYGAKQTGTDFTIPVRIMGGTTDITAFQMIITFNSSVLRVTSDSKCSQGSGWLNKFECTTNNPVNQVLLLGYCTSTSCSSTGEITVASIVFTAVQSGYTVMTALIVKLVDGVSSVSNVQMLAGKDLLIVNSGGTVPAKLLRSFMDLDNRFPLYSSNMYERETHLSPRRLTSCSCLLGDTNSDCVFDVSDVVYLQLYIGGSIQASSLTSCQLAALDPDLNGVSDGVDIQYLARVLAKKYRFISSLKVVNGTSDITASCIAHDDSQALSTSLVMIKFEFQTSINAHMWSDSKCSTTQSWSL
eukprot:gene2795-5501_t